jgi:putative exosortase-associated protein (TIGR04073 family)
MDKKLRIILIAALICVSFAAESNADNMLHKAGRGLKNVVISPVEVPVGVAEWSKEDPLHGLTMGVASGVVNCLTRMTAGVIEFLTSPFPPYDEPVYDNDLGETIWGDPI